MKIIDNLLKIVYVVMPLIYMPVHFEGNMSQSAKFFFLCSIVSALLVIQLFSKNLKKIVSIDSINSTLFFLFIVCLISVIKSNDFILGLSGSAFRNEGVITLALYYVLTLFSRERGEYSNLKYVLVSATFVSVIGIFQKYGVDVLPRSFISENWNNIAYSTIGNPNFLGSYLVLVLPIAMYEYVGLKKWYGIPIYGLIFFCLLATMSRGPWLGAMFAFGSFAFLMWKYGKFDLKRFSALVVLSLSLILLFNITSNGALLSRFKTIGNDIGEVVSGGENIEQAGSYRMFIWIRSFELVKQNPIWGVGIEQLGYAFIDNYSDDMIQQFGYVGYIDRAHNEYLHIAVSSGIPSLLLYLIFLMLVLRAGWINLSKNSMLIPVYSAVLGYLLQAFFNISVVSVAYLFWIYLGFLVSVDTRDKTT